MNYTKATKACRERYKLQLRDQYGVPAQRLVNCCRIRASGALFVKGMRCVGRESADCPLKKAEANNHPL